MGEKTLVERQVDEAVALVQQLDAVGLAPKFAAWYFYTDVAEWRLVLAGAGLDQFLPKQEALAYQRVIEALGKVPDASIAIADLKIIATSSPLVRSLGGLIRVEGLGRIRMTDNMLNGLYIKDVMLLRAQ